MDINAFIEEVGIQLVTGVPDSLLSGFLYSLDSNSTEISHQVAPNEGIAVALASGHYLGSGRPALVYMQNSGLPNALNPLTSLAHKDVYGIPMLLVIGWRGAYDSNGVQVKDEPQHLIQGSVTQTQLSSLGIPFEIGSADPSTLYEQFKKLYSKSINDRTPTAILIPAGIFDKKIIYSETNQSLPSSLEVMEEVLKMIPKESILIGSTGMIGRELLQISESQENFNHKIFMNVGAMGHASTIAKGIAQNNPDKDVICFDGDGALAMHFGSMALLRSLPNFKHILINNNCHDSVGRQASSFTNFDLSTILTEFTQNQFWSFSNLKIENIREIQKILNSKSNSLIEFLCKPRETHDLPRPKVISRDTTDRFVSQVRK